MASDAFNAVLAAGGSGDARPEIVGGNVTAWGFIWLLRGFWEGNLRSFSLGLASAYRRAQSRTAWDEVVETIASMTSSR